MQTNQSQEGAEMGARDELWETLGRHTAAGRTLFNLYCKSKPGAEAGRVYTERNRRILEACKNRGYRPPPPPALVPKAASDASSATGRAAKVAVPRCRGGAACDDDLDDWLHASGRQVGVRGRRPATEILKEQEKVEEELLNSCPPPPRGPLLDDQEKLRCARLMEWRGKLPEEELHEAAVQPPSQPLLTPASGAGHSPQNGLQALFDQVLMEVEERQKFLSEMKAYPKSEDSRRVVQQQLAERIETLKQLDRRLKEAEGLTARANADPNSSE